MITIKQPLCFTEQGMKDNQEDYLFPSHATPSTRTFILCDGMGGHDNGEVASATAATAIGNTLVRMQGAGTEIGGAQFAKALADGYDALDKIDTGSPKKPGTTLTCLCLNQNSYLAAHMGDSRIYHIRPSEYNPDTRTGGIIYQSSDHSLVNDLLKAGELTEQEARTFPQRNVITRAMQPHLDTRYKAEVYSFNDVEAGDYFFLCCDGILERLSNDLLVSILSNKVMSDIDKLKAIKDICDGGTRDNYTCWLIPVASASIVGKQRGPLESPVRRAVAQSQTQPSVSTHQSPLMGTPAVPNRAVTAGGNSATASQTKREGFLQNRLNMIILIVGLIVIVAVALLGWHWYKSGENPNGVDQAQAPVEVDMRSNDMDEMVDDGLPESQNERNRGYERFEQTRDINNIHRSVNREEKQKPRDKQTTKPSTGTSPKTVEKKEQSTSETGTTQKNNVGKPGEKPNKNVEPEKEGSQKPKGEKPKG